MWNAWSIVLHQVNLSHTISTFNDLKKPSENIVGKDKNAGNQYFLLFLQCFLSFPKKNLKFLQAFTFSSANAFNLVWNFVVWFWVKYLQWSKRKAIVDDIR